MKTYIIDAHCHIYPEKIANRAVEGTNRFYGAPGAMDGRVSTLLERGTKAGIDRFVVCSVATTPHQVSSINRFIAQQVGKYPERFTGLGALHPESELLDAEIEEILSLGLRGVKLHPEIQGFRVDDPRCMKIYECCEGRLPILMHTGDNRYDMSNPNRLVPIVQSFPKLTFIGAHFGGYTVWEEAAELLAPLENFYVDCSSSFPFLGAARAREILLRYGADRVMFGTDYPMWYPEKELETLRSMELGGDALEKILSRNAARVFDIPLP